VQNKRFSTIKRNHFVVGRKAVVKLIRVDKIECSDAVLETLNSHGVEYIFSSPGSEMPPIWEALARRRTLGQKAPNFINCRHEELAVSAATACALITRKLTAVLLHTTVGTLHASMAIRMAYHYDAPLVIIAGKSNTFGEGSLDPGGQWLRHLTDAGGPSNLVRDFVKWSESVENPETLTGMVEHACEVAISSVCGPTFLTIPLEVMLQSTANLPQSSSGEIPEITPSVEQLSEVSKWLLKSSSPLIVTEHLGKDPEAVRALVNLSELFAIPVVESKSPSCVNFPRNHPLHLGFDATPLLKESDLIMMIGAEGPWHPSSKRTDLRKVVVIDDDSAKSRFPLWDYKADLRVTASPRLALLQLFENAKQNKSPKSPLLRTVKQRRERVESKHAEMVRELTRGAKKASDTKPLDTRWASFVLGRLIPKNAIVVEELTTHRTIVEQLTFLSRPGSYFSGHIGGLGTGLGFALGAKLVSGSSPVIALVGDGAFSYNPALACLGFVEEHNTPILIVVFNNSSYDAMKDGLLRFYPDGYSSRTKTYIGTGIVPPPNYVGIMKACGGFGERVDDPTKLEKAFRHSLSALARGKPALIDMILASGARRK
jgi:acetolactate synthase-1/2/3 large subunit